MSECLYFYTLKGELEYAHTSKVVDLDRVNERVIKTDTSGAVYYNVSFVRDHGSVMIAQAQLVNYQVSCYWHNFLFQSLSQPGVLSEKRCENFRRKNGLGESLF